MHIIFDKITTLPPHALNRREVKSLFSVVPDDWKNKISIVHLKATLPDNSRFERPVIYSYVDSGRLNICSRGLTKDKARQEILRELAIQALQITMRIGHRLSDAELKHLDEIIAPFLQKAKTEIY